MQCPKNLKSVQGKCVKRNWFGKNNKSNKVRNRIITAILIFASGYILIINNSLQFLDRFGISVNQNAVAFIGFFITLSWVVWKANTGEL